MSKNVIITIIVILSGIMGYIILAPNQTKLGAEEMDKENIKASKTSSSKLPKNPNKSLTFDTKNLKDIYYAGGCFWGVEAYMSHIPGVYNVTVGYANGKTENPTYEEVCYKNSGHAETVHVQYDPSKISLDKLTEQYFKIIQPTSLNKQGNDTGSQYRTGIYFKDASDKEIIDSVVENEQKKYDKPIVTEVLPLTNYYLAEEYHQDYLEKNPDGYCHISFDSLKDVDADKDSINPAKYSKPSDAELKQKLTKEEYNITQKEDTERSFTGKYWDNKEPGLYVDITTGEPLFISSDKFDSGTGWPSFTKPIDEDVTVEKTDKSLFATRTEVRSKIGDSHLGHVFEDGPEDKGGLRYCINSASLKFVHYDDMEKEGYGEFKALISDVK